MTPKQLRKRLDALGFSQMGFGRYVGVDGRSVRRWVAGEQHIPTWVGVMLGLLKERQRRDGRTPPPAPDTAVAPFPDRRIGRNLEDMPT